MESSRDNVGRGASPAEQQGGPPAEKEIPVTMNKNTMLASVLALGMAMPALAGSYEKKCTMSTQDCLDMMAAKLKNRGWVGIEMDQDEKSGVLTVVRVVPESPAEKAGFQKGDVLKALNGIPMDEKNEEKMKSNSEKMVPGAKVTYTVDRAGKDASLEVELGKLPEEVLAQWVGGHMVEHAKVEIAQK